MRVGGSQLDPAGGNPYIIAEVGSNFESFDDCLLSIQKAAEAGANAVKFQHFTHLSLYGIPQTKKSAYNDAHELQLDWIPRLKQKADQCRIDFMCTTFDPQALRTIDPHVFAHKIASSDLNYEEMLNEVAQLSKPVFLSTGAATETEISLATAVLSRVPTVVLYCVANYPASNVDLTVIDKLKRFSPYVGFSDHTTDYTYLDYAANKFHGACVIEKHFTAINAMTPDSGHSLKPMEFRLMVEKVRGKRPSQIGPLPEERDMILRHKRRLIATEAIKKGDLYKRGKNFGVHRSLVMDTKGLPPWAVGDLHNKVATRDLEPGEAIAAADFG